jgi:hypothetical protein
MGGLFAAGVAGPYPLLAACGGDSSSSATATPRGAEHSANVGVPTLAPSQGASAATASATAGPIAIKAHELDTAMVFGVDRLSVPAGKLTFNFSNTGKMT